jgi:hypothetical protein
VLAIVFRIRRGYAMTHDFALRSRRFAADVLLGIAALFLLVAALTATTDPYLLLALALVVGVALLVEPSSLAGSLLTRQSTMKPGSARAGG